MIFNLKFQMMTVFDLPVRFPYENRKYCWPYQVIHFLENDTFNYNVLTFCNIKKSSEHDDCNLLIATLLNFPRASFLFIYFCTSVSVEFDLIRKPGYAYSLPQIRLHVFGRSGNVFLCHVLVRVIISAQTF